MWLDPRYHMCTLTPKATDCVDAITNAILDALANNTRFKNTDGKDFNFVVLPPSVRWVDDNGNLRTDIPRLMRPTNRFMIVIEDNKWLYDYLSNKEAKEEVINYFKSRFGFDEVLITSKDEKVYVCFFMKKSTYNTEEEESSVIKHHGYNVYKLTPVSTDATDKEVVPTYYLTAEAAERARECLWANGDISSTSDIEKISVETNTPNYKGVIIQAELLPPEHELDEWHIVDESRIQPISYEDYVALRYPDAKDEIKEQELLDADNAADLQGWLPYESPEDACGKRYFYAYFPDRLFNLAKHSPGNLVLMMSDAYEKFMFDYRKSVLAPIEDADASFFPFHLLRFTAAKDDQPTIQSQFPQILMFRFSYPDGDKTRRDIENWTLAKLHIHNKVVWSLDPESLKDTIGDRIALIDMADGVMGQVEFGYLFNMDDALPLVVFGRFEVFLFIRYSQNKEDNDHLRLRLAAEDIAKAYKAKRLKKIG